MKRKRTVKMVIILVVVLLVLVIGFAKHKRISPISWGIHHEVNRAVLSDEAINGYDPVAYFMEDKAVKGKKEYSYKWNNATWRFSTEDNLHVFIDDPGKYAPQFGGYCAFAVSKGFTANTDPDAFTILDGKLYLCAEQKRLDEWLDGGDEGLEKSHTNWR